MAESHSHKFGQIIGDLLELAITPHLEDFIKGRDLFLDKKGNRHARTGKKVTWIDKNGNKHDLDFVIERNGTDKEIGKPVAFIESAWRRYTKHSRNKAQEIQSAIIPLRDTYNADSPFIGVILAGVFTSGAITQLESLGFSVLYFSYESVIEAFARHGIDAHFDEKTTEEAFEDKINAWQKSTHKEDIAKALFEINRDNVCKFILSLENSISRVIDRIIILPLHGQEKIIMNVSDAITFLVDYNEKGTCLHPVNSYEIIVKYSTGDRIDAKFKAKDAAIKFLKNYEN